MLDLVRDSFLKPFFEHYVIASDLGHGPEPFNRALAKNNAADHAGRIDDDPDSVLVFCDSDTYAPYHQVEFAVRAIREGPSDLCLAHNGVGVYLSGGIGRGNGLGGIFGPFPGGVFAIRRSAFYAMGGFDPKFVGWGHEDLCFLISADKIFKHRITLSNHESVGPFFKLDLLYPRITHEGLLMDDLESEQGRLYQRNTRRRDAYIALEAGDAAGYWALRDKDIE